MALSVPTLEVNSWSDFKTTCLTDKKLLMQYVEDDDGYDVYATDSLVWHIRILKGTSDATDFENNYKATANVRSNMSVVMVDRDGTEIALPVGETAPLSAALIGGVDDSGDVQALRFDGVRLKTDATGSKVILTDGTHDADITAAGRLAVDVSRGAKGVVDAYLLNGGSNEMAVDADPTPQEFVWNPGAKDVEGSALSFVIEDATIYFGDKFGGVDALGNGVLLEIKASDVVYTIANIKRTGEFSQLSCPGGFDLYAATPDHMRAELSLEGFMFKATGTYATDDYVKVTIRDDIDGLSHMSALFKGREV